MISNRKRLLAFEALRIVSVWLIVASHVGIIKNHYIKIQSIYDPTWGGVGVTLLLIVSGAVLEYNYKSLSSFSAYGVFLFRRLTRIYPAYWISIIIALLVTNKAFDTLIDSTVPLQMSGFMAFTNQWGGKINAVGWFIGLIVILYMMFPLLSKFCRRNPQTFFLTTLAVSAAFRYYFITNDIGCRPEDWFPLCRIFEFGLGIYIVRLGLYPKWTYDFKPLYIFSEMSFYIFLVHFPIVYLWKINPAIYIVSTLVLSYALMLVDEYIQETIVKNIKKRVFLERVKVFQSLS